jgi:uncharacterized membrane protein
MVAVTRRSHVFEKVMGLPMHVLVIHFVVVLVPLLAVASIVYAVVPRLRSRVGWVAGLLAIGAPILAFVAKQSGEAFKDALVAQGVTGEFLAPINTHQSYGDLLFWFTLGLGVATLVLLAVTGGNARVENVPTWVGQVLSVVVIALAVASGIYVYLTGDSGARAVWEGTLQ